MNQEPQFEMPFELERYELYEEPRYHFEPDRREFLQVLGGGVLVCLVAGNAQAQKPGSGRGGTRPAELDSWIHINEQGQVTVFTGKVEVGQNIRTSLSQVVAEELRMPVSAIRMVMADTDLTPVDGGTAGSRTTPDMGVQLRRVAASTREVLIDLAAEQAKVERATLVVADGKVTHPASKQTFAFGELTKGKKLTKTIRADAATAPPAKWKVAGTSILKVDGGAMVTGKHKFTSDVQRPGMLHGKVLRPDRLNSSLVSANLKAAEAMAGVTAIRDGDFVGVAAPTQLQAEQALAAIQAEWKSAAQLAGKDLFTELKKGGGGPGGGGRGGGNTNQGSMEKGLAAAAHTVSSSYTIAYIAHTPLEPRGCG